MFNKSIVTELTPKNTTIKSNGFTIKHPKLTKNGKGMLAIVADWCGYCKALKPTYQQVAGIVGDAFPMFFMDAVKFDSFVTKMGVSGFPTIKVILENGTTIDYTGDRSLDGLLANICKISSACKKR